MAGVSLWGLAVLCFVVIPKGRELGAALFLQEGVEEFRLVV